MADVLRKFSACSSADVLQSRGLASAILKANGENPQQIGGLLDFCGGDRLHRYRWLSRTDVEF
ncbi:hypothetical protein [Synechococcus sp. PCC 7336]|uniref:hypothetical protein n=1 Tax=Synechococcus sp. PCC 7336 TaxID=195250 RepID=UPI000345A364|nr:hypothetical protein [Synechococcus sp. PCC 7336]